MIDIQNRADLELITSEFYKALLADEEFENIFITIAQIDLEEHLPIITDFWETSLLGSGNYKRNTLQKHLDLNEKYKLTEDHFNTWLEKFNDTVDKLFQGVLANKMKVRALSIANVIRIKIAQAAF